MALTPFFARDLGLFDPLSDKIWDIFEHAPSRQFAKDVSAVANTRVDWVETPEAHVFKADLPGLRKEEIKIQIEDGRTLQISGERKKEEVQESDKWHRIERAQGSFMRSFRLPENAKVDEVKAKVENGVLTVTVPKHEKPKPQVKAIEISG